MNILIDDLPYTVRIRGEPIPINTDYRTGILFEQVLLDPAMSDDDILWTVLDLYYGDVLAPLLIDTEAVTEAINQVMWFYRCGMEESEGQDAEKGVSQEDMPFSYEYDAAYIYAAFMEAYRIDLTKNRLHWWQFRALFVALPERVQFSKIVGYRTMEIPAKMPKEQKKFYQKMKKIHKIPESAEQKSLEKELEAILAKGGNISALVK